MISLISLILFGQAPIDFADYLYKTGDYRRAALEYERIGVMSLQDAKLQDTALIDSAWASYSLLMAGEALLKVNDPERAANVYRFGAGNLEDVRLPYGLVRAHYLNKDYGLVDSLAATLEGTELEYYSRVYASFGLALAGEEHRARQCFSLLGEDGAEAVRLLDTPVKRRSPGFSAGLSTVLPGAGQAYCGRWGDAWQSFSVTGLFMGAAAYYFFFSADTTSGNTVKGVVTASLGGLFWLGNIYGAANAALDYNEYEERKKQEQLRNLINRFELEPVIERP